MNVGGTEHCYGCGLCAAVCRRGVIEMKENEDGFYEPSIEKPELCTDCGLCLKVCAWNDGSAQPSFTQPLKSFAAWSNDAGVRWECSSGGVAFELERTMIADGYTVCAARYSVERNIVEHYIANTEEELMQSVGSKYLQSLTTEGFRAVKPRGKNVVVGTPCQIDGMRRWTRLIGKEDNFLFVDFFCHGVPSRKLWNKYLAEVERHTGKAKSVSWRSKKFGWHDSWLMEIDGDSHAECRWTRGDAFFTLFLSDQCLGKACYERCRYKYNCSSADVRLGDMWGNTMREDDNGVSAVVAFTQKGLDVLLKTNCTLKEMPFDTVAEGQMKTSPKRNKLHRKFRRMLADDKSSTADMLRALYRYRKRQKFLGPLLNPKRTIRNIIFKRILRKR